MKIFSRIYGKKARKSISGDPVADFFVRGSASEKKKVYDEALRKADSEQKEVVDKYKKQFQHAE